MNGQVKALFPDQIYDLPDEIALASDWLSVIETAEKALSGPPRNKAVRGPSRTKQLSEGEE